MNTLQKKTDPAQKRPRSHDASDSPPGSPAGSRLRRMVWDLAHRCNLAGLLDWPLEREFLRIERRKMPLANLGWEFEGARLAHLSDLHCSPIVTGRHLRRYVDVVNSLEADFVVITGDFLTTGPRCFARRVAGALRGLRPAVATLACLGNHDYGVWHPNGLGRTRGLADVLAEELTHAGIFVLRNACRAFFRNQAVLQFVGLEDYWTPLYDADAAFEYVDRDSPAVVLAHNPDAAPHLASHGAEWILAGHTHGKGTPRGRFWDLVYPTRFRQFVGGEYRLGRGRRLYVNRGIGNSLRSQRDQRAEITLFTLCQADQPQECELAHVAGAGTCRGGDEAPLVGRE